MTGNDHSETETRSPFLPPRWVIRAAWRIHRGMYRRSGGRMGLRAPRAGRDGVGLLTTIGRRSGMERGVMIGYFEDGDDFVTMAMNGWDAPDPAWWLNLQANPRAALALVGGTVEVTGRAAMGPERDRLWERWREIDKGVDRFAARRPGGTAVVVLSPSAG